MTDVMIQLLNLSTQEQNSELVSRYHLSSVYLAGMFGGTVQLAIACPVELIKIRLQTSVQV